jgi:hypothetical protein
MKTCKCGNQVARNARFCTKCGHRFTHPFIKFVAVSLGFFALLIVIAVIAGGSGEQHSSTPTTARPTTSATVQTVSATTATPSVLTSKWHYQQSEDKMRNAVSHYAMLDSDNRTQFSFPYSGGSTATIVLRNSPKNGRDIMLQIDKGQFLCQYDGCYISVKFDDRPVQTISANEPSDGSSTVLFISDDAPFLRSLRKAKSVTIEAPFYQAGTRQFQFSPTGLEWK